jgi:hypothetical protein
MVASVAMIDVLLPGVSPIRISGAGVWFVTAFSWRRRNSMYRETRPTSSSAAVTLTAVRSAAFSTALSLA